MRIIENKVFPYERALYAEQNIKLKNCKFDGIEDGESALKETKNIFADRCVFNLRYPMWHADKVQVEKCTFTDKCRAALWYSRGLIISDSTLGGIKALRECSDIRITGSKIVSPEFGWKCRNIVVGDLEIESEYPFFMSRGMTVANVSLLGKYSFQYTEDVAVENCDFNTKDAFWHAKNVTIKNTVIKGEYFSWYSENLTLINCKIKGTQPLCYCKGLKLINCEMEDADFAFEYSDVQATVRGKILSVKNPLSGEISADAIEEIILSDDSVYKSKCIINTRLQ